jgi:DNA-binding MarR family transcriptional regulator
MSLTRSTSDDVADLSPLERDAWRGFLRVQACLCKQLDAQLELAHRLPLSSYDVLVQLADAPDHRMRMCDLATSVLLSRSGMSRLADRLERDGLIKRCACTDDARGAFACITPAGLALLGEARPTYRAAVRSAFLASFDEHELEQLRAFWARIEC